jgi:hypothetical protein
MSVAPVGAATTVPAVKAAVEGVVAPMVVLFMVLLVMFKPDWSGEILA